MPPLIFRESAEGMASRLTILAVAAALAAVPPLARAADPPIDADFLEFLGSVDSDDPQWNEYVASEDMDEALDRTTGPQQRRPAADAPPAGKAKTEGADDDS